MPHGESVRLIVPGWSGTEETAPVTIARHRAHEPACQYFESVHSRKACRFFRAVGPAMQCVGSRLPFVTHAPNICSEAMERKQG